MGLCVKGGPPALRAFEGRFWGAGRLSSRDQTTFISLVAFIKIPHALTFPAQKPLNHIDVFFADCVLCSLKAWVLSLCCGPVPCQAAGRWMGGMRLCPAVGRRAGEMGGLSRASCHLWDVTIPSPRHRTGQGEPDLVERNPGQIAQVPSSDQTGAVAYMPLLVGCPLTFRPEHVFVSRHLTATASAERTSTDLSVMPYLVSGSRWKKTGFLFKGSL